jgi:hypothetical protein
VVSHDVSAGADWVTSSAVRAEDRGVAVQASEVICASRVGLLVRSIENVPGLVGGVHHITPKKGGTD